MARAPTFLIVTIIAYLGKLLYDRATVLGAFRGPGEFFHQSEHIERRVIEMFLHGTVERF